MEVRFQKLYSRKLYVHHYEKFMEPQLFDESIEELISLKDEYQFLQNSKPPKSIPRFTPEL